MEFQELLQARRSIRAFDGSRKVTMVDLEKMVKAATQAPSWKNSQTARYYAVWADETIREFSQKCLPEFNQNSSKGAAYVVTTFVKDVSGYDEKTKEPVNEIGNGWGCYDLGLHNANFIMAAKELGYDTLIMGIRDEKEIRKMLWIPADEEIMAVIAVGYGAAEPRNPVKKTPDDILTIY